MEKQQVIESGHGLSPSAAMAVPWPLEQYLNDGNGTNAGHVRIYKNINGTWTQQGSDIDGEAAGDGLWISLSPSAAMAVPWPLEHQD
jgi:hypothetical protein